MWIFRGNRRPRPTDAGINQSAFVGFLVAVMLLITSSMTVFGPAVGRNIADFLICKILNPDSADCINAGNRPMDPGPEPAFPPPLYPNPGMPPQPAPNPQAPSPPDDDITIAEITLPGDDCSTTAAHMEEFFPGGTWSSGDLGLIAANLPPGMPPPVEYDIGVSGTFTLDGCNLSVEMPEEYADPPDGVRPQFWKELAKQIAAGLLAILLGAIADAILCSIPALFPVICGAAAGFVIGFFWNVFAPLFDKGYLNTLDWVKALASGLIAAVPGGYGYTRPLGKGLVGLFRGTAPVAERARVTLPRWVVDEVGGDSTFDLVGTWGQDLADLFDSFELEDLASGAAP